MSDCDDRISEKGNAQDMIRTADVGDRRKQQRRLDALMETLGAGTALFAMCAILDVPYAAEFATDDWDEYICALEQDEDWNGKGFLDGETDISVIRKDGMTERERWETVWGTGAENRRYTDEDYRRLDELFRTYSYRLQRSGGMDVQQEDTLRVCSRMRLEADKAVALGTKDGIDIASKLNKMIQDNLSAENLRKKDEKPIDDIRIDGIADALQKKYGISASMSRDEVVEICCKWLMEHKYPYTLDAANQMLLAIINTTRRNNDEAEMEELPDKYRIKDVYREFAQSPNETEREVYKYLGLTNRGAPK